MYGYQLLINELTPNEAMLHALKHVRKEISRECLHIFFSVRNAKKMKKSEREQAIARVEGIAMIEEIICLMMERMSS